MDHFIRHRMNTAEVLCRNDILFDLCLMNPAIDYDDIKTIMILKDCYILQRIPIDNYAVCIVADFDLAHFVRTHE